MLNAFRQAAFQDSKERQTLLAAKDGLEIRAPVMPAICSAESGIWGCQR